MSDDSTTADEETDFISLMKPFVSKGAGAGEPVAMPAFGSSKESRNQRKEAQRRAGMSQAERDLEKKKREAQEAKKVVLGVRTRLATKDMFVALCKHLGKSQTDVMQEMIERLAKRTPGFQQEGEKQ
jgi:hypothetical protein